MKYLLIISLLVFFSCKKERTFHITAKNAATGEPYPHGDYFTVGWYKDGEYISDGNTLPIKKGKKLNVDLHLVPYGTYRIVINNINCQGVNDTIIIHRQNEVKSFLDKNWTLTGCSGYTTAWDKIPMGTIHTKYTVIKGGVSNTYEEDFVVEPNQQNEQVIDY